MNNLAKSLVRTYSPMVVGVLTELYTKLPETVELDNYPGLVSGAVAAIYYFIPRAAEHLGFARAGILLGSRSAPVYGSPVDALIAAEDAELPWSD